MAQSKSTNPSISINGRLIGADYPPLVIAEIGINHGGDIEVAIKMADAAIDSGAEIIKHQTHIPEDEMSNEAKSIIPGNANQSIYKIIDDCSLSEGDERHLMLHVQSRGASFISTPFSRQALARLERFDIPAVKIGSGECNNYPFVELVAKLGKPVILSTGMNSLESVRPSVEILRSAAVPYALLHCTNIYPTPPSLVRLDALRDLQEAFPDAVIGLSDHTTANYSSFGAVAIGASIIERHFTDSMSRCGPDICCSMDPKALEDLIRGSTELFECRGGSKESIPEENGTIAFAFASVVAETNLYPGDVLSGENIWLKRPGNGHFGPADFQSLLGKRVVSNVLAGEQLGLHHIE